jgi:hypothetical protein
MGSGGGDLSGFLIGFGGVGRTRQEGTSVDEIRDFLTRNRTSRVVWCDAILVVPVTWDLDVADFVNLLCVFDVPENEVGTGLDPNPIDVGTWRDFYIGGRWFPKLCGSVNETEPKNTSAKVIRCV